jgi:hypothetical protein
MLLRLPNGYAVEVREVSGSGAPVQILLRVTTTLCKEKAVIRNVFLAKRLKIMSFG